MQAWGVLLRSFPAATICFALLFFGSGMVDKVSVVPVGLQGWLAYVGTIMMLFGGIGLIIILPRTIYQLYQENVTST